MHIDREAWSGDGDFTLALLDALGALEQIAVVRVLDAPSSRAEAGFNFVCNDLFVGFRVERHVTTRRLFGLVPVPVVAHRKSLTLAGLDRALGEVAGIGSADYADDEMLQYLRAERSVAPYQARGSKIVELVRVFEAVAVGRVP